MVLGADIAPAKPGLSVVRAPAFMRHSQDLNYGRKLAVNNG